LEVTGAIGKYWHNHRPLQRKKTYKREMTKKTKTWNKQTYH